MRRPRARSSTNFYQTTRAAVTVRALALLALTAMATPAFATTPTAAAASGKQLQTPSALQKHPTDRPPVTSLLLARTAAATATALSVAALVAATPET